MNYLGYTIELKINNQVIEILPTEYSFSTKDSIYSIFNKGILNFHDVTGLLQESFLFSGGIPIGIKYGIDTEAINSCNYIITRNSLEKSEKQGILGGNVLIRLSNSWSDEQGKLSTAYSDRISNIVKKLAQKYNFQDLDVESTGNNDIWYQTFMSDAEFINNVLLPNAYSKSADNTPFYCYVTNDNVFHLKSAKSMFGNSLGVYNYTLENQQSINRTTIISLKRWQKGTDLHGNLHHRHIFKFNKDDGGLEEDEDYITDYLNPMGAQGASNVPLIYEKTRITDFVDLGFTQESPGQKENLLGQLCNSMKEGMFLERLFIVLPFNPKLKSGNPIDIRIFSITENSDNEHYSENYSGKWIIEECTHVWDGPNNRALTKLLCGRKYVNVTNTYLLKEKLV